MSKIRAAFIISLMGTIFLTVSGLIIAFLISPYGSMTGNNISGAVLLIGAVIIFFLLIGNGLLLSSRKSNVTAGLIIIVILSGISFLIGSLGIFAIQQFRWYLDKTVLHFAIGIFYIGVVFLLFGSIVGLARELSTSSPSLPLLTPPPPPYSPSPSTDVEIEIKKYEGYLDKLEQLRREGKVSEKAYAKLKDEYENKLEELVDKWKK